MKKCIILENFLVFCACVLFILALIFAVINDQVGKSVETISKNIYLGDNADWLPNENVIIMTKQNNDKWNWRYTDENGRELVQVCKGWYHNSVFRVDDMLVTYYENHKEGYSILMNDEGICLYRIIPPNDISRTKYIIKKNKKYNIIGYVIVVNDNSFIIENIHGDLMITHTLRDDKLVITKTSNNTIPLLLSIGVSSKIVFNTSDKCNNLWRTSYLLGFVFLITLLISFAGSGLINIYMDTSFRNNSHGEPNEFPAEIDMNDVCRNGYVSARGV